MSLGHGEAAFFHVILSTSRAWSSLQPFHTQAIRSICVSVRAIVSISSGRLPKLNLATDLPQSIRLIHAEHTFLACAFEISLQTNLIHQPGLDCSEIAVSGGNKSLKRTLEEAQVIRVFHAAQRCWKSAAAGKSAYPLSLQLDVQAFFV